MVRLEVQASDDELMATLDKLLEQAAINPTREMVGEVFLWSDALYARHRDRCEACGLADAMLGSWGHDEPGEPAKTHFWEQSERMMRMREALGRFRKAAA